MTDTNTRTPGSHDPSSLESMSGHARDAASRVASSAMEWGAEYTDHYVKEPAKDLMSLAKDYAKDHPDVAACWAFGLGVLVGWKLKP